MIRYLCVVMVCLVPARQSVCLRTVCLKYYSQLLSSLSSWLTFQLSHYVTFLPVFNQASLQMSRLVSGMLCQRNDKAHTDTSCMLTYIFTICLCSLTLFLFLHTAFEILFCHKLKTCVFEPRDVFTTELINS